VPSDASAEGYKGEKTSEMTPIRQGKTLERGLDRSVDRSVEFDFDLCFQQNVYGGWLAG
jgi:hypothetical protein